MKLRYLPVIALVMFASCADRAVKIKGRLVLCDAETVYLDLVSPTGTRTVDSVATDQKGNYKLRVKTPEGQPAIYNLRCSGGTIPLVLSPGERVEIKSMGRPARNYTVTGSEGSEHMRELNEIMLGGASSLDSITTLYSQLEAGQDSLRRRIANDYARQYYKTKREQIRFIVTYPKTLAAFYALYQRLPNDKALFNGEGDVVYYRLVADSLTSSQPLSPYLSQLAREIENFEKSNVLSHLLQGDADITTINYPDVELPDMYGKKTRLSSLHGQVILLDFWLASDPRGKLLNAEMKEQYESLHPRGFEIYQVSLDTSKPMWVTTVQAQRLPWVSVCDLKGIDGPAPRSYNVSRVPTNFLIDRQGNIVGRDLYGDAFIKRVREVL